MLDLTTMQALRSVSECGSIRGAATEMHLTTSAVSQRLAKLERQLGQPLLERNGRGVRLTDAARLLVSRADRILSMVDEVEAELESFVGAVVGHVRLAGFPSAVRGLMTAAVAGLRREFPQLDVHMAELEVDRSLPLLARGDIDVAVVQDWTEFPLSLPAGIRHRTVLDDVADIAVAASHPLAGSDLVELAQLVQEPWVTWPVGSLCHNWLLQTLRGYGTEPRIAHTAEEYATQLNMVAAGFGVAMLPRLGRSEMPQGVRVVPVRERLSRQVHLVWRAESKERPAITSTVQALADAAERVADPSGAEQGRTSASARLRVP